MWQLGGNEFDFSAIPISNSHWTMFILLLALLLTTLVTVFSRHKFLLLLKSLFSKRAFSQLTKEIRFFSEGSFDFIFPAVFLTFPVCVIQLMQHLAHNIMLDYHYFKCFVLIFLAIIALFAAKYLISIFLFKIFDCEDNKIPFLFLDYSYLCNTAIVLWTSILIVEFTGFFNLYWGTLTIIVTLYVLKTYKKFLFKSSKVNLLQFFLYFCTLEILPYLICIKLVFIH